MAKEETKTEAKGTAVSDPNAPVTLVYPDKKEVTTTKAWYDQMKDLYDLEGVKIK